MKKPKGSARKLIALVVFIVGLFVLFVFLQYKKTHISTEDAYITNDIYWVHPKVAGSVVRVLIKNNQYVKKGQLLAVIDRKPYEVKLHQAQAEVELAKARLKQASAFIDSLKAKIKLTQARLDKATWDLHRAQKLYKSGAMPKDKYEYYLTNYRVLKFELQAQQEGLKEAKASLESVRKSLEAAEALFSGAKLNLSYTLIKAPAAGFVTKKGVEVGKFVSPATPICALVPNAGAWIVANYKESQINAIKKGQKVIITIDAYPGKRFEGVVNSIQFGTGEVFSLFPPENASGNWIKVTQRIPVKILFTKPPKVPLRVGMSTRTVVLVERRPSNVLEKVAYWIISLCCPE